MWWEWGSWEEGGSALSVFCLSDAPLCSGDEMFSDSFDYTEVEDGFFYKVDGKVRAASALCLAFELVE